IFLSSGAMDIRRTILWLIFAFSVLLLWNNWQTYNGRPSIFGTLPAEESVAQDQNTDSTQGSADSSTQAADATIPRTEQPNEPASSAQVPQEGQDKPEADLVNEIGR